VVVGILPTGSITCCNREPSKSDVVHDHIRLRQHQIAAIACTSVCIGARYMKHAGTTEGGETVGGASGSSELSPSGGSAEMINDSCTDANRKVLVKGVGENPLPAAQAWGHRRPSPAVAAPGTGHGHIDLLCYLRPAQALFTKLHDLLCGGRMRRGPATHGDAGTTKLLAHRGRRDAQLDTDLTQGPTMGVHLGCTLNVHGATVTSLSRIGFPRIGMRCRRHLREPRAYPPDQGTAWSRMMCVRGLGRGARVVRLRHPDRRLDQRSAPTGAQHQCDQLTQVSLAGRSNSGNDSSDATIHLTANQPRRAGR
jgi:hypothetical protein